MTEETTMITVNMKTLTELNARVGECQTFETFKDVYLQYLDACIGELGAEEDRLKDAAREILGLNE